MTKPVAKPSYSQLAHFVPRVSKPHCTVALRTVIAKIAKAFLNPASPQAQVNRLN